MYGMMTRRAIPSRDLPLKLRIWQDNREKVWMFWNSLNI
jgi:hypothetical protein